MTRPGAPLPNLLRRAAGRAFAGARPAPDDADAAILDAALTVLARRGTRAATIAEVATVAGVGRATIFRRFASKDDLFERALTREITTLLDTLAARLATIEDPTEQVAAGFALCLDLHRHPLLTTSPTELLQALTHGDRAPITLAHARITAHIAHAQSKNQLPQGNPSAQADALIHITLGYLLTPSLAADLTDPEAVAHLARLAIAPILTGPPPP